MDELCEKFAMKCPPDNTIVRIEALEKLTQEMQTKQDSDKSDLEQRITKLEGTSQDHEARITKLENSLKALEDAMGSIGNSTDNSQIDTN